MFHVYKLRFTGTDFFYIGTTGNLEKRFIDHKSRPLKGKMQELKDQGCEFVIRSLKKFKTKSAAHAEELKLIHKFKKDKFCLNVLGTVQYSQGTQEVLHELVDLINGEQSKVKLQDLLK
jgi:predicted GIY-YIG superfamily endonuclease